MCLPRWYAIAPRCSQAVLDHATVSRSRPHISIVFILCGWSLLIIPVQWVSFFLVISGYSYEISPLNSMVLIRISATSKASWILRTLWWCGGRFSFHVRTMTAFDVPRPWWQRLCIKWTSIASLLQQCPLRSISASPPTEFLTANGYQCPRSRDTPIDRTSVPYVLRAEEWR